MKVLDKLIIGTIIILTAGMVNPFTACNGMHFHNNDDMGLIQEKSFQISPGKNLKVKVSVGDVTVTAWDKSEVYVKIFGDEDAEEEMRFEFDSDEDMIEIIGKKKNSFSGWFGGLSVLLEIKVPAEFNVDIKTSGGYVKYGGISGNAEFHTSGGDIWGEGFNGKLYASTSGGDITLIGSDSKIDASTSGGNIKLDYSGDNKGIELNTSGGDILVHLPADFNASVKLHTSGGNVYCNLNMKNVSKSSDTSLEGDINEGGNLFIAETSGGDVDVLLK